eukprot:TRINITY_DN12193_c0_g1_i1.p1 TRINITY_DN12193_c0_g1~~TRINITY_DN12193_c0_g1_i1.p1  ORF type:complete len:268 (-),score=51.08 TRINITY_DN12193_c0_g1_i1:9-812(-)
MAIVQSFISMLSPNGQIDEIKEFIYIWVMLKLIDRVQMTKGKDPILDPMINMSLLDKLRLKHTFKEHLRSPVERMLNKIMAFPYYYKVLSSEIKFEINKTIKLEKIHKAKYEPIERIWRKSPTTVEETKIYASPAFLEEITVKDLNSGILPVLSRNALSNEKFDEIQQYFTDKFKPFLGQSPAKQFWGMIKNRSCYQKKKKKKKKKKKNPPCLESLSFKTIKATKKNPIEKNGSPRHYNQKKKKAKTTTQQQHNETKLTQPNTSGKS